MGPLFFQVAQVTIIQFFSVFGVFFIFGFILSEIQGLILKNYSRSIGWRGILWTAWLGTPVHEYSHALTALLFRHKISEVALFSPDALTGELGHVSHSYNRRNLYQSVGNFFIGLAPLIIGPLLLVFLLYALVPNGREIFTYLSGNHESWPALGGAVKDFLIRLFSPENLMNYRFWFFLYISFAIASHLAPSKNDRRDALNGGLLIVAMLFLFNIFALLRHWNIAEYSSSFFNFFAGLAAVYIYVLMISFTHLLVSALVLRPWRRKQP